VTGAIVTASWNDAAGVIAADLQLKGAAAGERGLLRPEHAHRRLRRRRSYECDGVLGADSEFGFDPRRSAEIC